MLSYEFNYIGLKLAIAVGGLTLVTTLLAMGKFRRFTASIRSLVTRSSGTRSVKYQQIRTEVIESEERHVNCLEFVEKVFHEPLEKEGILTPDQLYDVFINTKEVLAIHKNILHTLKSSKKSFEKTIYGIFHGQMGIQMEKEVGLFCIRHKLKGMNTWIRLKSDERIKRLINPEAIQEAHPNNPLAKLTLDDHLSAIFQRPLRYPLLLERLLGELQPNSSDGKLMGKTLARSREIAFNINEQVRKAERLIEIEKKTDRQSGLPELNLTDHILVRDDRLTWRVSKQKSVDVLLVLTDKNAIILRREPNGRFTYKYQKIPMQTNNPNARSRQTPLIQLVDDLITKPVATDTNAFFIMSSNQDVLYELVAPTLNERNLWMEAINKTAMNAKNIRKSAEVKSFRPPAPDEIDVNAADEVKLAQELKRDSSPRKSWFDSLSKRKSKALSSNLNKRKSQVKQEVKAEVNAEFNHEVDAGVDVEIKQEVKPDVKQDIKSEVKPEVKPDVKTFVKPDVKRDVKPEVKQRFKQEINVEVKPEVTESAI